METNTDMLRGRVDIFILKALSIKDGYGYDILNYIHDRTEGHYEMKQSSIYSVLKRLEKQGYVKSYSGEESNGAKRRYYSLTDDGKKLLQDEEKEWEYTRTLLDNLVSDKEFDLISDTPPFHPSDLRPLTRRTSSKDDGSSPTDESTIVQTAGDALPDDVAQEAQTVQGADSLSIQAVPDATYDSDCTQRDDKLADSQTPLETVEASCDKCESDEGTVDEPLRVEDTKSETDLPIAEVASSEIVADSISSPIEEPEQNIYDKIELNSDRGFDTSTVRGDNYREFFGNLFDRKSEHEKNPDVVDIDCSHINDLRNHLDKEGIKLRSYEPTNAGKGLVNYVLVNRLYRDSIALSYLFMVIMLLIVYLYKPFSVNLTAFLSVMGVGLIFPVASTLIWFNAREKKKKACYNVKIILSACGIIYLTFFVINLIINLIIPNGRSVNSVSTYAPAVVFLVVPFFGLIFSVLYGTKNYHLKAA